MHPWHDVELGKKFPKVCTAVVEIPRDTNTKYKLDAKTGLLKLGECLPTVARYPANYGFFPRTVAADGDALDVFIFGAIPFLPLTMVEVRVLGGAETVSKKKGTELKLIAVCPGDPEFARIETLRQLSKFYLDQLSQFFATYRQEEGDVRRLVDFYGKKRALHLLKQAARDTSLEPLLEARKVKRLLIAGLTGDNCVLFSAHDAYLRGLEVWVPGDCVASESEETNRRALGQMQCSLKADVRPLTTVLNRGG